MQTNILNENLFTILAAPLTSCVELSQEDFRPILKPARTNTLDKASQIMLDRISVLNNKDIGQKIGALSKNEIKL